MIKLLPTCIQHVELMTEGLEGWLVGEAQPRTNTATRLKTRERLIQTTWSVIGGTR